MSENKSTYSWRNHPEKTTEIWRDLYRSKTYTDVTLVCNDKKVIEAHRIILNASSPVLGKILDQNTTPHPWIYLRGIDFEDMEAIINFLYNGEASVDQSKVNEFFEIAEDLEIAGITNSQEMKNDFCSEQYPKELDNNSENPREISKKADEDPYDPDEQENTEITRTISKSEYKDPYDPDEQDDDIIMDDSYDVNQVIAEAAIESPFIDTVNEDQYQKHEFVEEESFKTIKSKKKKVKEAEQSKVSSSVVPVNNQEKPHQCTICGSRYISIGGLEMHTKLKHKTKLALVEAQNPQNYVSRSISVNDYAVAIVDPQTLTNQATIMPSAKSVVKVSQEAMAKFKCNLCDYKTSLKATLKLHILQVHIGKTYNCVRCEFTTKQKDLLKKHLNEAHKAQDLNPPYEDFDMPVEWVNVKSI